MIFPQCNFLEGKDHVSFNDFGEQIGNNQAGLVVRFIGYISQIPGFQDLLKSVNNHSLRHENYF